MQGSPFILAALVVIRSSFSICISPSLDRRQRVFESSPRGVLYLSRIPELGLASIDFDNSGNYALLFSIIFHLRPCPKMLSAAVPALRVNYSNLAKVQVSVRFR